MSVWKQLLCVGIVTLSANLFTIQPAEAVYHQVEWQYAQRLINSMQGDWYNDNGVKVLSVTGRYINGCEVLGVWDWVGSGSLGAGVFRIQESTGTRDMHLEWVFSRSDADAISLNGEQVLHRTQNYYYESIAGIHLGMTAANVEQKLGAPTQIATVNNPVYVSGDKITNGWFYKDKGILVTFASRSVNGITLFQYSNLRLERSGLNCSSSMQAFAQAYNLSRIPSWPANDYNGPCSIGHGEYIFFGKNMKSINLSIYNN